MTLQFSKIPILTLSIISVLPIVFASGNTKLWCFVNILVFTFFSIWTYSITKKLVEKNNYDDSIKLRPFTIQLILTNIYIIALSVYFALTYPNTEDPKWMLLIIIIGQFFALITFY